MSSTYQEVYAQIKALENNQTPLPLPAPTDTIIVGSIDAQSGVFTFLVPTFAQTIQQPPAPGTTKPSPPIELTVGVVATNCVNLTLAFEVTNAPLTNAPLANAPPPGQEAARVAVSGGGNIVQGSTGDVTISGFPSGGTQGTRILLNAGLAASALLNAPTITPGVGSFPIGITVHGQLAYQHIAILRPPVLGVGAFTIPALPVAIIFAPPQGQLKKNSNTFTDKVTVSTTTTVSISTQTDTKTALAYTPAQLAANVAGLATQVVGMMTGFGALITSAGTAASLINVISGPPGGGTLTGVESGSGGGGGASLADMLKAFGSGFSGLATILQGLDDQGMNSGTSSISTTTNNTLTISVTYSDTYGSEAGKGPGDGDRIVYLQNVLALWSNLNGDVGLTVLGYSGVEGYPGDALVADQQALAAGGVAVSQLDANTIEMLLDLDPYYVLSKRKDPIGTVIGPPLLGLPRFTPLSPLNRGGSGTSATGDVFSLAVENITDTSTTNTNKTINVTDTRPGWIDVLFGADNVETTTTVTATNTVTSDQKVDQTTTNTVTMVSAGADDPYNVNFYYDNLSQTIVPVAPDSPVLQGSAITSNAPEG
jgi:hypothetical protein